jgi:RHS repeat-associated protein
LDNHLGSASLELDENANIISYEEYHPFGTTSYRSGRTETEISLKRYKYVGKERDEETGLYYYGFRYYAAWLCRFISVDPLQFEYPQLTPYNYAGNKPVTHIDIDGLQSSGDEKLGADPIKKDASTNATWDFTKGTGRGLWNGLKGTWSFITDGAWKAETWLGTGNLLLGLALTNNNPAGITSLMEVDEKLGTNTLNAVYGLHEAIDQGIDKFTNGDWGDRGEVFGSTLYAIGESVIGSKGAGVVTKSKFGANLIAKTKNATNSIKIIDKSKQSLKLVNKFTTEQIDEFAKSATKNNGADNIMLGKYRQGGVSYTEEAGKKFTYFELDNWDDISKMVDGNMDEMWELNSRFLDNQFKAGKGFYFSHDPSKATGFFSMEVNYIKNNLKAKGFIKSGKYWKAVW